MCQLFDESTKSVAKYCENPNTIGPKECLQQNHTGPIDTTQILQLKLVGCSNKTVLSAIETFENVRTLDISFSGYKSLKWLHLNLKHLTVLNMSHNALSFLPWRFAVHAPKLVEIDLSHNELTNIDAKRLFDNAEKLVRINLSYNSLRYINYDAFATLSSLEYIDLTSNRFLKVPIFPKNTKLRVIRLEENPISSFDCFHTKITPTIVSVYLNWNNVSSLYGNSNCEDKRIRVILNSTSEGLLASLNGNYELHCKKNSFKSLRHFIAGHNSFENIADMILCFEPTIWHLDLTGNSIGGVNQTTFERFVALRTLFLSDTNLTEFDFDVLKNLNNLTKIDISLNNLKHFKNTVSLKVLDSLYEFNVDGNRIENITEVVGNLKSSIEKLNLSGNTIGKLRATVFQRFSGIRKLNLSKTELEISDANPFKALNTLTSLDISNNNLKNTNFEQLSSTLNSLIQFRAANCNLNSTSQVIKLLGTSIESLDLSGNVIDVLSTELFEKFDKLKTINLSNGNLIDFDVVILKNQLDLRTLDLSQNQLEEIDFKLLPSDIRHLNIEGNELHKVDNFFEVQFPSLRTLAISRNQLTCQFLRQIENWRRIKFIGDPFRQKHGQQCQLNVFHIIIASVFSIVFLASTVYFGLQKLIVK